MLIYLLQRVWFNGGFKREYCSVKILEYSIWIFKVAVKELGGAGSARRRTTGAGVSKLWQPGAGAAAGRSGQRRRDWRCLCLGRLDAGTPVWRGS